MFFFFGQNNISNFNSVLWVGFKKKYDRQENYRQRSNFTYLGVESDLSMEELRRINNATTE